MVWEASFRYQNHITLHSFCQDYPFRRRPCPAKKPVRRANAHFTGFRMPPTGVEPVLCLQKGILSPSCLPISPQRPGCLPRTARQTGTDTIIQECRVFVNRSHPAAVVFGVHLLAAFGHGGGHVDVVFVGALHPQLALPDFGGQLADDVVPPLADGGQVDDQLPV